MIESFRDRALRQLFETGAAPKIAADLRARILVRLDALDTATDLRQLNRPGFDFHPLRGKPLRYSIHVNRPWCITFEWQQGRARRIDLEQYH
ncbi:MAG TPA: type II toxin-antitoxin system RelE/ParE family toxin [Stellaceae bacterium]|nr:type II toxin-antitoxin system RelE/ParE family toxin [Stellaceae bacterium]